ncbi:hypothetical protein BIV59_08605 [Bacillus sp. MUM 13]|nr:hypothetical protein BIV59_08605 [Bacillus sp. MUM 13]
MFLEGALCLLRTKHLLHSGLGAEAGLKKRKRLFSLDQHKTHQTRRSSLPSILMGLMTSRGQVLDYIISASALHSGTKKITPFPAIWSF